MNNLTWDFKAKSNVIDVKVGQVNRIEFEVENYGDETTYGVASFNVSPSTFGKYYSKLGCFCFEKQELKAGEKATYVMTFYLDPEMINDPSVKNLEDEQGLNRNQTVPQNGFIPNYNHSYATPYFAGKYHRMEDSVTSNGEAKTFKNNLGKIMNDYDCPIRNSVNCIRDPIRKCYNVSQYYESI